MVSVPLPMVLLAAVNAEDFRFCACASRPTQPPEAAPLPGWPKNGGIGNCRLLHHEFGRRSQRLRRALKRGERFLQVP